MVWNVYWITERRSVTIIIIYSPHVLKTITEKPSYYLPQNGQDAKANINSLLIHRIPENSLLALIIWWPHFKILFCRTVLKKEPSNRSVVDSKTDWVNSGWETHQQIQKSKIGLISRTTTLHVHHAFLYISLPSLYDYDVKLSNFTLCGGCQHKTMIPFFFLQKKLPIFYELNVMK